MAAASAAGELKQQGSAPPLARRLSRNPAERAEFRHFDPIVNSGPVSRRDRGVLGFRALQGSRRHARDTRRGMRAGLEHDPDHGVWAPSAPPDYAYSGDAGVLAASHEEQPSARGSPGFRFDEFVSGSASTVERGLLRRGRGRLERRWREDPAGAQQQRATFVPPRLERATDQPWPSAVRPADHGREVSRSTRTPRIARRPLGRRGLCV